MLSAEEEGKASRGCGGHSGAGMDVVQLRRPGWRDKVGWLWLETMGRVGVSSSSSLSISKQVMLAAALFTGRDLCVSGGRAEKEDGTVEVRETPWAVETSQR